MTLDPYLSEGHAQYVWPSAAEETVNGASQSARTAAPRRPPLARRRTALRLSGEFATEASETRERFAGPKGVMPLRPARHPTNLRLQDHLQIDKMPTSESKSQFVDPGDPRRRPPARRHATSLKMEGNMDISPEYRTAYTEVQGDRPPIIKPKENLTAHGQMFLETEKREMFQNFQEGRRRPALARHATNLKLEGSIEAKPEYKESFNNPGTTKPQVPKAEVVKPESKTTLGGTKSENLYPEFKDWYLDFPRKKPLVQKGAPPHNFRFDADLFRRRMPERRQTMYLPSPPRRTVDSVCLDGYGGTGSRFTRPLVRFDSEPAFLVHERDEAECNRRAVFPLADQEEGKNRGVKRVTMGPVDGEGEGDSSESAEGFIGKGPSAFRVLEASGLSTESEDVDERLTSLKLDQEGMRSKSAGALPAESLSPSSQPLPPCGAATPLYCATANAPFYCTGASPPHHLYFGGFCPNWTQANGLTGTPTASYCPSIVPPQGTCPTAPPSSYCPAFLPPIHPYVSGCCPPPVQVSTPEIPVDAPPPSSSPPVIPTAAAPAAQTSSSVSGSGSGSAQTAENPGAFVVLNSRPSDSNNNHLDRKSANGQN